jgi:Leucine-rich repeat (LRR) protein
LQQLEELHLGEKAFAATSLQGLAGLSNLRQLVVESSDDDGLVCLEGVSPGVVDLSIICAPDLKSLAGIEGCTSLEALSLETCGVSSLQPLRGLSNMERLAVSDCKNLTSLDGLNSMALQSLSLDDCSSLTHVSGVEHLSALKSLFLVDCPVTSMQPLAQLGEGLQTLKVSNCHDVQEEILELPNVQPTADVVVCYSNVKEVVLAGGVRKAVLPR